MTADIHVNVLAAAQQKTRFEVEEQVAFLQGATIAAIKRPCKAEPIIK